MVVHELCHRLVCVQELVCLCRVSNIFDKRLSLPPMVIYHHNWERHSHSVWAWCRSCHNPFFFCLLRNWCSDRDSNPSRLAWNTIECSHLNPRNPNITLVHFNRSANVIGIIHLCLRVGGSSTCILRAEVRSWWIQTITEWTWFIFNRRLVRLLERRRSFIVCSHSGVFLTRRR